MLAPLKLHEPQSGGLLINTTGQLAFFVVGIKSLPTMVFNSMQARMASMNYNVKVTCIYICYS